MIESLRRNWGLKLVTLALAYVSWMYVVGRSPGVRFLNVPVEVIAPEGLVVMDYTPHEVRVRLQGDAPRITPLSEQNVYARVVLDSTQRVGRSQKVPIQEREIQGVPSGVIKEILTSSISVTLEKKVVRTAPVRVRVVGAPPPGHRIERATAEPDAVEISGPEDALRGVDVVWTEGVDASRHRNDFTGRANLIKPDTLVTVRPDIVHYVVLVVEEPAPLELELPVQPSVDGYEADPPRVRVTLEGPPSLLQRVGDQITAIADAQGLPDRGGWAPVRLDFGGLDADASARIRTTGIEPARVRLRRAAP